MQTNNIKNGVHLSLSAIANAWGRSRETVKNRLDAAGVQPADTQRGHPVFALKDVVNAFKYDFEGVEDPEKLEPFARRAYFQAEHEKLRVQSAAGELLSRIEAEGEFARLFEIMGRFLDTLPDHIERAGGVKAHELQKIEDRIDKLREELYEEITSNTIASNQ
jgi:hypothetical protein